MRVAKHPAAYLHLTRDCGPAGRAGQRYAVYEAIRRRGWPEPQFYLDEDDPGLSRPGRQPALDSLTAAIAAGRHDALLLLGPGVMMRRSPGHLMKLLVGCSHSGVAVEYIAPPVAPPGPI